MEAAEIRAELRRCEAEGALPAPARQGGPDRPAGLFREIDRFCSRVREEVEALETGLAALETRLAADRTVAPRCIEVEIDRLERTGTVWSLQVEVARKWFPQMRGDLGACFTEFSAALQDLRRKTASPAAAGSIDDVRTDVARLRRIVAQWLKGDAGFGSADGASEPPRGETR